MQKLDPNKLRKKIDEKQLKDEKYTQRYIAEKAMLTEAWLSRIKNKKEIQSVNDKTIYLLCKALECEVQELVEDE